MRTYPYEYLYNINTIEEMADVVYPPITLSRQINFTSVEHVKQHIREYSKDENNRDDDVVLMLMKSMEVMFGHYSTCKLPHVDLVSIFRNLFSQTVVRLYWQNILLLSSDDANKIINSLDPHSQREINKLPDLDRHVLGRLERLKIDKSEKIVDFKNNYRTKNELLILITRFVFNMGGRFYKVPFHSKPTTIRNYMRLRVEIINEWFSLIDINNDELKLIDPYDMFKPLNPITIAMIMFPPNAIYDTDTLTKKSEDFNTWLKDEMDRNMEIAKSTGDKAFMNKVDRDFKDGQICGTLLQNALKKRSEKLKKTNHESKVEDIDFSGSSYLDVVNKQVSHAEAGKIHKKMVNNKQYGITDHAYQRGRERGISERAMLAAAHNGRDIGNRRVSDGKNIVVMDKDTDTIITTYPEHSREKYSNVYAPPVVSHDSLKHKMPIKLTPLK